jgi:hypothetical protein
VTPTARRRRRSGPRDRLYQSPLMRRLTPLVGNWEVTLGWSKKTHEQVGGPLDVRLEANFSWLEQGGVLHYEIGQSHWFIGGDEDVHEYPVFYTDTRPISRVYSMSFTRGVWRIWRDSPGFRQRFEGRLLDKGQRIEAHWDKAEGGRAWERDFDLSFDHRKRAG